jgi:hypothetical protein
MRQSAGGIVQAVSIYWLPGWSESNADRRGRASIFTRYSLLSLERKEPVKSRHGHAHCCQLKTESPDKSRFPSSFAPPRIPFKQAGRFHSRVRSLKVKAIACPIKS